MEAYFTLVGRKHVSLDENFMNLGNDLCVFWNNEKSLWPASLADQLRAPDFVHELLGEGTLFDV